MLPQLWKVEDVMIQEENYNRYYEATTFSVPTTPRSLKSLSEAEVRHAHNVQQDPLHQKSAIEEILDFHLSQRKVRTRRVLLQ